MKSDVFFKDFMGKCYELQKCGVGAFFRRLIAKAEFKNLLSTSTFQVPTVMKRKTDVRTL